MAGNGENQLDAQFAAALRDLDNHDYDGAINKLEHIIKHNSDLAEAYLNLGFALDSKGQKDKARKAFAQAVKRDDLLALGWNNLGAIALENNDLPAARTHLFKALECAQSNPQDNHTLGFVYRNLGQLEECCGRAQMAAKHYRNSWDLTADPDAGVFCAAMLIELGDYAQAKELTTTVLENHPKHADALINRANAAVHMQQYDDAAIYAQKACDIAPENPLAFANLATALRCSGKEKQARQVTAKCLELDNNCIVGRMNNGLFALADKDYHTAIGDFEAVLECYPSYVLVLQAAGDACYHIGQFEKAVHYYRRAIAIYPDNIAAKTSLAGVLFATRELDDAATLCREVLETNPDNFNALLNLGSVCSAKGLNKEAERYFHQACAARPDDALGHFNLGHLFFYSERIEQAEQSYRKGLKLEPDNATACVSHCVILRTLGQYKEAFEQSLKAIKLNADLQLAHENAGFCLYSFVHEQPENMAEHLKKMQSWEKLAPDNPFVKHTRAALFGGDAPPRCSDDYVRYLFDDFAVDFDKQLAAVGYCGPDLVEKMLVRLKNNKQFKPVSVAVDLGCGTGLCAPVLQKYCGKNATLIGVDISSEMLKKAEKRGVYHQLECAEMVAFLQSEKAPQAGLVCAADVLTYTGDLAPLFAALQNNLSATGGLFVFITEGFENDRAKATYNNSAYVLRNYGRYTHSRDYIVKLAATYGFEITDSFNDVLRYENEVPSVAEVFALRCINNDGVK